MINVHVVIFIWAKELQKKINIEKEIVISTRINRNWCLNKVNIMLLKKAKYQNDEVNKKID